MTVRPTLVLLPGLLCDASVWAHQAAAFAATHEVVVPVFRGYESIPAMAASVLDRVPGPFALAGHSMGGRVALEVVRRAPDRVERLALLDTGVHPRKPGEEAARQALVDLAHAEGMEALARRWLPPMVHPDRVAEPDLMGPLTAMVCRATPAVFAGQVRALLDRPDASAQLAAIRCPTALVVGRQDGWSPVAQHEPIAAAIAGATLTVVEDCGHMATVERPEAVTEALRGWLQS
ncbi:alpha/beta fold hydrolase [Azospirillum sp. ST 5-10]|uniref:alpha/beta fold hydrolase n=1 Tax=unclassified Azospirillum TaxID=2630922 RepID=UPI003F4A17E6